MYILFFSDRPHKSHDFHMQIAFTASSFDQEASYSAFHANATWCPHIRLWAAIMMDFIPEAQTLLMVVAGVPRVKPGDTVKILQKLIHESSFFSLFFSCYCYTVNCYV